MKRLISIISAICITISILGSNIITTSLAEQSNNASEMIIHTDISTTYNDSDSIYVENPKHRFADKNAYFVYKFTFSKDVNDAYFMANIKGADFKIEVSKDAVDYQVIGYNGKDEKNGAAVKNVDSHYYSLSTLLNSNQDSDIFIKFSDKNISDGNGSDLYLLDVYFNKAFKKNIHLPANTGVKSDVCEINRNEDLFLKRDKSSNPPGNVSNNEFRYFDMNYFGVYEFTNIPKNSLKTELRINVAGSYRISVSSDAVSWEDRAIAPVEFAGPVLNFQLKEYVIDISDVVRNSRIYIKLGDATVDAGWGGAFSYIAIDSYVESNELNFNNSMIIKADLSNADELYEYSGTTLAKSGEQYHRFADMKEYFTYKVVVPKGAEFAYMMALAYGKDFYIQVSKDNKNFADLAFTNKDKNNGATIKDSYRYFFSLDSFLNKANETELYIRFSDKNKTDGNGTDLFELEFAYNKKFINSTSIPTDVGVKSDICYAGRNEDKYLQKAMSLLPKLNNIDNGFRYFDMGYYGTYKFILPKNSFKTALRVNVMNSYRISISKDGIEWTDIAIAPVISARAIVNVKPTELEIDITRFIGINTNRIYIKLGDATLDGGWGGSFNYMSVDSYLKSDNLNFGNSMVIKADITNLNQLYEYNGSTLAKAGEQYHRFADMKEYFTYKVVVPKGAEFAYMMALVYGKDFQIEISKDNKNYTSLAYVVKDDKNGATIRDNDRYFFSLDSFLNKDKETILFVKFSDKVTTDGNGSDLYQLEFYHNNKIAAIEATLPELHEKNAQTFLAGSGEKNYFIPSLSKIENTNNLDMGYRYFDAKSYGVYKFQLNKDVLQLQLCISMRSGYRLSVSADGANWEDIAISSIEYARAMNNIMNDGDYVFDISFLIKKTIGNSVYLKIGDATEDGGWGGSFKKISLIETVKYNGSKDDFNNRKHFTTNNLVEQIKIYDDGMLYENKGSKVNGAFRTVKGKDSYFAYKFELPTDATSFFIAYESTGDLNVEISNDGKKFEVIDSKYRVIGPMGTGSNITLDLKEYIIKNKTLYLKFSDAKPDSDLEPVLRTMYAGYNAKSISNQNYDNYSDKSIQYLITGDPEELIYWQNKGEFKESGVNQYVRFFDKGTYGIYKFSYSEKAKVLKVIGTAKSSFRLAVSKDGKLWSDRIISDSQYQIDSMTKIVDLQLDVSDLMDNNKTRDIYIKVSDLIDDNGDGGCISGLGVISLFGNKIVNNISINSNTVEPIEKPRNISIPLIIILAIITLFCIAILIIKFKQKAKVNR